MMERKKAIMFSSTSELPILSSNGSSHFMEFVSISKGCRISSTQQGNFLTSSFATIIRRQVITSVTAPTVERGLWLLFL
jgi:hypothetical protein